MRTNIINSLMPQTRSKILSALLLSPEKWWYLRDLAKHLGLTASSLQREMNSLNSSGILESRREGNRRYYRANKYCPIFNELQGILVKTYGVHDVLVELLSKSAKKIRWAFIYGSIARDEEISESDVDLMIIGDITLSTLAKKLSEAEEKINREVNPTIYSEKEFIEKLKDNHFIKDVINNKKIFLIGTDEEFKEFVG